MYPLDGLRLAGVDMSSTDPVDAAFAALADTVTRLEELLDARSPHPPLRGGSSPRGGEPS
jgi:oligoendopeptidase F